MDVSADQWTEFMNDLARLAHMAIERTREKMASQQLGEDCDEQEHTTDDA